MSNFKLDGYKFYFDNSSEYANMWRWHCQAKIDGNVAGFKSEQQAFEACLAHSEVFRKEEREHIANWVEKCVKDHPSGWSAKLIADNIRNGCVNDLEDMPDPHREFKETVRSKVQNVVHYLNTQPSQAKLSLQSLLEYLETEK